MSSNSATESVSANNGNFDNTACTVEKQIEQLTQDIMTLGVNVTEENFTRDNRNARPSPKRCADLPLKTDSKLDSIFKRLLQTGQRNSLCIEDRKKLPAYGKKEEILKLIRDNPVILIKGETGCGKTTQVPQYILDDCIENDKGSLCKVICTQPRKISAIGVAKRVAKERGEPCGTNQSTGYQVRLDRNLPRQTGSILYCTTGVMINLLHKDPLLSSYSHVILDEVHERNLETDFLIILLRDLSKERADLRLILMSATMKAETFSEYFNNCPTMEIPGFTYPVEKYMLEDVVELTEFTCKLGGGHTTDILSRVHKPEEQTVVFAFLDELRNKYSHRTLNTVRKWNEDNIDFELVITLLKHICAKEGEGAILVFLPGWNTINDLYDRLSGDPIFKQPGCLIIMLHSMIPIEDQEEIFNPAPEGVRKIVLSTNIAETSVTIEDVVFVIDCGKMKLTSYDGIRNISSLEPCWVSKANAQQRRGRAGRVKSGKCYHLFTSYRYSKMKDYHLPEMVRTSLANICLIIKYLKLGDIRELLSKAIDQPLESTVSMSVKLLQLLKALDEGENLTMLGSVLAQLPLDPRLAKLLLFGALFSCLDPVVTIAAVLDYKDPFHVPRKEELTGNSAKVALADNSQSDHIMFARAFEEWSKSDSKRKFCKENFLSFNTLKMIKKLRLQFVSELYNFGFLLKNNPKEPSANINSTDETLLKGVICAGLYPNVAFVTKINTCTRTSMIACVTEEDGKVYVHPKSIQRIRPHFSDRLLVYYNKMRTSRIFLYDTTAVSPTVLFAFCGEVTGNVFNKVDGFYCRDWTNAEAVCKLLFQLLEKVIGKKIKLNWKKVDSWMISLNKIVNLIRSITT